MRTIKDQFNIIAPWLILIINILWSFHYIWLFYAYHFTNILWLFMYPDWVLIINIIIGFIGIYLGLKLLKKSIGLKKALIIDFVLIVLGTIIGYVAIM